MVLIETALVFGIMAMIFGLLYALVQRRNDRITPDEAEMMQQIHKGLARMEQRIEALETILLETHDRAEARKR